MNREQLKGQWTHVKDRIKEKWGKLTEDELTTIDGKYDQLVGKIQERYGLKREQAEEELKRFKYEPSSRYDEE